MRVHYVRLDGARLPQHMRDLLLACRRHGWKGRLDGPLSGARTYAEQRRLWELYEAGKGNPAYNPDAPDPEHRHRHETKTIAALGGWSCAVDVTDPVGLVEAARRLGAELHRPYKTEPWHVEAVKEFNLRRRRRVTDKQLVARMRKAGIVNPIFTLRAARAAKLKLHVACALLEQETSKGHNEFGHDPTTSIPKKWMGKAVTARRYRYYKRRRKAHGFQGVGPMQLTYGGYQDLADKAGGCHKPYANMLTGFRIAAHLIAKEGLTRGLASYNGHGPRAAKYATEVEAKAKAWRKRLFA